MGNASARDVPAAAEQCLPEVPPPASSETAPPPPAETETSAPEETVPPTESSAPEDTPPAESPAPPAEEPPASEAPAEEPAEQPVEEPAEEPAEEQPAGEEPATEPQGLTAPAGAQPEAPADQPAPETAEAGDPAPDEAGAPPPVQAPEAPPADAEQDFGNEECEEALGPFPNDFINIRRVQPSNLDARPGRGASRGTFEARCGNNENRHNNPDNFIVAPGVRNGAQHLHDYVGSLTADANSTNENLVLAGTTCRRGDLSTYYWPVVRQRAAEGAEEVIDEENPHNTGTVLQPARAQLVFKGNANGRVVAMPQFIRVITGDAKASTNGGANANAKWTCTGFTNRVTAKYPLCPRGSSVMRILDFPSCWDGQNIDSANHRAHIVFPDQRGRCPQGTRAVPALQMRLTFNVPRGSLFALDAFPGEKHNPVTDHGDFVNVMPQRLMDQVVRCINSGRRC
ncbi:MAG TPA: DUF1996 domain-containing protein [Actinophytocola sp.]|nr:DUF1996 domain-containing protein [Actinophytocola sp.]